MVLKLFVFILLTIISTKAIHVQISPTSSQILKSLYSNGITIGHQSPSVWNVYVSDDKMDVFKRLVPKYQQVAAHKTSAKSYDNGYTSYYSLLKFCVKMQQKYQTLATKFTIGMSVENRKLIGLKITSPSSPIVKKKIKLVGGIHGNEPVGRQILLKFAEYLLENYGKNADVTSIMNTREIHILFDMNPDGFVRNRRTNARGYDLNRNFPDRFYGQITPIQPETSAILTWSVKENFKRSISFHGGSLVVNYPYDGNRARKSGIYTPTIDDEQFKKLALVYSQNHLEMKHSKKFKNGIVNGAKWYVLYGGSQDWNYIHVGTKELTIEVSKIKKPVSSTLDSYWLKNKKSLIKFCLY